MWFFISRESGSTMGQMFLASAVVLSGAAYMVNSHLNQKKILKTTQSRISAVTVKREISEALAIKDICLATINKKGPLSNDLPLDGIFGADGTTKMYGVDELVHQKKIKSLTLTEFTSGAGSKKVKLKLVVESEPPPPGVKASTYGSRVNQMFIPITLTVDAANVATNCALIEPSEDLVAAMGQACTNLGGSFDIAQMRCLNLHGDNGPLITSVRGKLCGQGKVCEHPYKNVKCPQLPDNRGVVRNNHALKGFTPSTGAMECECLPRKCPDPALVCVGVDTGSDWCTQDCPAGTKVCT